MRVEMVAVAFSGRHHHPQKATSEIGIFKNLYLKLEKHPGDLRVVKISKNSRPWMDITGTQYFKKMIALAAIEVAKDRAEEESE